MCRKDHRIEKKPLVETTKREKKGDIQIDKQTLTHTHTAREREKQTDTTALYMLYILTNEWVMWIASTGQNKVSDMNTLVDSL